MVLWELDGVKTWISFLRSINGLCKQVTSEKWLFLPSIHFYVQNPSFLRVCIKPLICFLVGYCQRAWGEGFLPATSGGGDENDSQVEHFTQGVKGYQCRYFIILHSTMPACKSYACHFYYFVDHFDNRTKMWNANDYLKRKIEEK